MRRARRALGSMLWLRAMRRAAWLARARPAVHRAGCVRALLTWMLRSGACRRFRECGNVVYANVIKDEAGELRAHGGRAERPVVMQWAGLRSVACGGQRGRPSSSSTACTPRRQ